MNAGPFLQTDLQQSHEASGSMNTALHGWQGAAEVACLCPKFFYVEFGA